MLKAGRIDFFKYRSLFYGVSFVLMATFITMATYRYNTRGSVFTYSVDFTGGTEVRFGFTGGEKVSGEQIEQILAANDIPGAITRDFSNGEVLVRVRGFENDADGLSERMKRFIEDRFPGTTASILQTDSVGASIGDELRKNSIIVVALGLLIMLLYIAIRFWSFSFAMGAIVALFHDVMAILTLVVVLDMEISLNIIAAVLFILGYSINDTIVVFSRIREHFAAHAKGTSLEIANMSINETLRRTILTSVATALTVVALLFGTGVLQLLAMSLLVGIVFGTYSSIYIATPVMLLLNHGKKSHS